MSVRYLVKIGGNKERAIQTNPSIYCRDIACKTPLPTVLFFAFKASMINAYLPISQPYSDKNSAKFFQINDVWTKEYKNYSSYIQGNLDNFDQNVQLINQVIAKIDYEDFDIELTPSSTIKYSLLLPDKKILIITKSFEDYADKAENEVIFSIFDNKKLILSDIKDLNELVSGINGYIKM
jgi:hypothetical protein